MGGVQLAAVPAIIAALRAFPETKPSQTISAIMLKTATARPVDPCLPQAGHKKDYCEETMNHRPCTSIQREARVEAVIEDIPMDTLVDQSAKHLRLVEVAMVAQVCVGLRLATLCHVALPAMACQFLRSWRQTARLTRTAWQTVMMWRGNASRVAELAFEASILEELEDMMKEPPAAAENDADLTDEEVDFLEHHMMKTSWEKLVSSLRSKASAVQGFHVSMLLLRGSPTPL